VPPPLVAPWAQARTWRRLAYLALDWIVGAIAFSIVISLLAGAVGSLPSLIGAAVAYAVSGEASVSGDQRLHEGVRIAELSKVLVRDVMQKQVIFAEGDATLSAFAESVSRQELRSVSGFGGSAGGGSDRHALAGGGACGEMGIDSRQ